jgi:clan AA aspartic protease
MSYLLDGTPVVEVVLENPFFSVAYPKDGSVLAVFDTGYEGFAIIPEEIFRELKLNELHLHRRKIMLPNGELAESVGTYGRIRIVELDLAKDGFIETSEGVDEIVLGVEFAKGLTLILDYCTKRFEISPC